MAVAMETVAPAVIGGVDTHKDLHVAAALDHLGRLLGTAEFPTTLAGYRALAAWLNGFGAVDRVGVEGTGAWGAGLSRFLRASGIPVIEVDRPNRQRRRRRGKSDATDAESAGRAVLAGDVSGVPKAQDGAVEMIRALRVVHRSAERARTQAANQVRSLLDPAPAVLREQLRGLSLRQMVDRAARYRPGKDLHDPMVATKAALRSLARRWLALATEIAALEQQLAQLVQVAAPAPLLAEFGVGPDVAGALLVAAGDNPKRLHSEASFAALCGASPLDASSGRQHRHRLNRGGNREANAALWRIVMVRLRWNHPETRAYVDRRVWRLLTQPSRTALPLTVKRSIKSRAAPKCSGTEPLCLIIS